MLELYTYEKGIRRLTPTLPLLRRLSKRRILFWLDMTSPTSSELAMLKDGLGLHSLILEDFQMSGTLPKVDVLKNGIFVVLYGIEDTDPLHLFEVNFFLSKRFLITGHARLHHSCEQLKQDKERLGLLFRRGADFLMHALIDEEIDHYFPVLQKVDDRLDRLQDRVLHSTDPGLLNKLFAIKRSLLDVRKNAFPQREVIGLLAKRDSPFISSDCELYFRDVNDHMFRLTYMLDSFRDIISTTLDVHLSVVSNKMNEVMKVLTIIATIMMPLTLITGIYGMNFRFMPELAWKYGYFFSLLVMAVVAVLFLLYFKRKRWL
ncbi:MAG: magnesium/cobalt transporter CorA [DPANN group archaeon]|nr:magnesium/cobalt transporter CorA [DPANN group archaeon]